MKRTKITVMALLILVQQFAMAQTGQWKLAGNNLAGTEKLGSTNNAALNFITNNKTRMSLTGAGNLNISSDQSSIQFALPGTTPKPMMFMFPSGTLNTNRMVLAHSPAFANFGLQYNDSKEQFDFLSNNSSILAVDLGGGRIGINNAFPNSALDVNGNTRIMGNVGIQRDPTEVKLHVSAGNSGITPFTNTTIATESTTDNFISLLAPTANKTAILFGTSQNNQDGAIVYNNPSVKQGMQFNTAGVTRMTLTSSGRFGLGTSAPTTEVHLIHGNGEDGTHGLQVQNTTSSTARWTLYANTSDDLDLFYRNNLLGFFENNSGEYFELSDARRKKDIEKTPDILDKVMQLDVKKYHFLESKVNDKKHYGMIAQEVEKIFPEVVHYKKLDGSNNDLYTMNYSAFGVIAIKAIQEQQKTIEEQQQKILTLEERIAKLEAAINSNVSSANNSNVTSKAISGTALEQNQPNPFNQSTVIRYHLPQGVSGQINLYDANGILVKTVKANESGQAVINGNDLKAGTYSYTLIINGKIAASKKMIIAR